MSLGKYKVTVIEHTIIKMSDGCELAAKIWLPIKKPEKKVPAILEYLPYRKRDGTAVRDELTHPYLASHGYACIRVDMRGSGESQGFLQDEYLKQEQEDCLEVLRWIAKQSWCTGSIGMMGISWGGFNSLQVAALKPPELKAIVSICSADDRYNNDIHYMGGCLLTEDFVWSATMLAMMSRAPDKKLVEDWRERWLTRISKQPLLSATWLQHPLRDEYWKHGSVCEQTNNFNCPTYLVGGWEDGYSNTVFNLLSSLQCPRKGLIGPWAHKYPHFAKPGPQIGFLQELLRWWDYWLKGIDTGIMAEPMLRVWMQDSVPSKLDYDDRPGRWVAEKSWPSEQVKNEVFWLGDECISTYPVNNDIITHCSPQSVGETGRSWYGHGMSPEKPLDQRVDDERSICFDMSPFNHRLEIFGAPVVELEVAVDKPQAFIVVRLNEVSPDGVSRRVTYGVLNLAHRNSHETLTPIIPGEKMHITMKLNGIAHSFAPGNHLRLAISTTYWPLLWPAPEKVNLKIFVKNSKLTLPTRAPCEEDNSLFVFPEPESAPPLSLTYLRNPSVERYIKRDQNNRVIYTVKEDSGHTLIDNIGLAINYTQQEEYSIQDDDPLSAKLNVKTIIGIGRDEWQTRTEVNSTMQVNKSDYLLAAKLVVYEGDELILTRHWENKIPRFPKESMQIEQIKSEKAGFFYKRTNKLPNEEYDIQLHP
ncbi:Cocaine esterase [Legionella beliardensis]|uniref:Cocaine esterase n=1 Tax=Legionella beliardensis TaxID=91822 RepID=A0A378I220_9GAMM|nr:CocE/NonD family hydrolase [Legionella beliardensis]STX29228.1 Cocaine esterase [Legionella beliardensis]